MWFILFVIIGAIFYRLGAKDQKKAHIEALEEMIRLEEVEKLKQRIAELERNQIIS